MKELEKLKIKREHTLLIKDLNSEKDNKEWLIKFSNFFVKYYEYFDDVTLIQYSRFGFVISYIIYVNNKKMVTFDEKTLNNNYNRHTMNKLILSKINRNRHSKYKIKDNIKTLSEIDY